MKTLRVFIPEVNPESWWLNPTHEQGLMLPGLSGFWSPLIWRICNPEKCSMNAPLNTENLHVSFFLDTFIQVKVSCEIGLCQSQDVSWKEPVAMEDSVKGTISSRSTGHGIGVLG